MRLALHRQQMKSAMLPIAMIGGAVFYRWMGYLSFLSPYLIFMMLFITYCKLDPCDFRPGKGHLLLLVVQMALAGAVYLLISPFDHTVAEGVFICVFMPTATAAPVITSMLGGSISFVATYSLLCNLVVALAGPSLLAAVGDNAEIGFLQSVLTILSKVAPLLLGPLLLSVCVRYAAPGIRRKIWSSQQLSFYLWAVALFIVVGNCVSFVISTWSESHAAAMLLMVVGSLAACIMQFAVGRRIGRMVEIDRRRYSQSQEADAGRDMKVSCAQSLMQKNTVLGVWLAMTYMNPLASVAPAAYIAWHNIVNSWQLIQVEKSQKQHKTA